MPSNPDRPFDHDTLKLRAVFVPEDARDEVSRASITSTVGHDAVKIPAVFVPEGGKPPGYPYEHFGRAEFRPDEDGAARRQFTMGSSSSQPPDGEQNDSQQIPMLPRTRYRFGAALFGGNQAGHPPNPALAGSQRDPTAAGIAVWRRMANPGAVWRQSRAAPDATPGEPGGRPTSVAAAPPARHISVRDQAYLDRYYDAVGMTAKEYGVDPELVLAVGVGSGFGTEGSYRKTGDASGMTDGENGHMPTVSSPEEDVKLFFHNYGSQIRGTGSDADAFINALQGHDSSGKRVAGWRRYNNEDPDREGNLIRSGISQMKSDVPVYLEQRRHQ
jgi:hypothetical protein